MNKDKLERFPGCSGIFEPFEGPTHRYMISSPACWEWFGRVLAREYSHPTLLPTHRLSVDAYAAQHPGSDSRRAIQSVGLQLARLGIQLEHPLPPRENNEVCSVWVGIRNHYLVSMHSYYLGSLCVISRWTAHPKTMC